MEEKIDYYNPTTSLNQDFDSLSSTDLSLKTHKEEINLLVINFVIKYLAEYLEIPEKDANIIKAKATAEIQKRRPSFESNNFHEEEFHRFKHQTEQILNFSLGVE